MRTLADAAVLLVLILAAVSVRVTPAVDVPGSLVPQVNAAETSAPASLSTREATVFSVDAEALSLAADGAVLEEHAAPCPHEVVPFEIRRGDKRMTVRVLVDAPRPGADPSTVPDRVHVVRGESACRVS